MVKCLWIVWKIVRIVWKMFVKPFCDYLSSNNSYFTVINLTNSMSRMRLQISWLYGIPYTVGYRITKLILTSASVEWDSPGSYMRKNEIITNDKIPKESLGSEYAAPSRARYRCWHVSLKQQDLGPPSPPLYHLGIKMLSIVSPIYSDSVLSHSGDYYKNKICLFPVNYESVMFYGTGPRTSSWCLPEPYLSAATTTKTKFYISGP